MTGRRTIVGLCMLCALAFSAIAAQGASAAAAGTTAFTCKNLGAGHAFSGPHCRTADKTGGEYEHVAIGEKTPTTLSGSSGGTPAILKSTQAGINVELTTSNVSGSGTMENKVTAGGEHYIHGTGFIEYKEIEVLPAALKCKVIGGTVKTNELTATSEGQEMSLKFQPKEGTVFATFEFEGCTEAALNGKYEVKGTVKSNVIDGATVTSTHNTVTTENTLKVRAAKAGIAGTLTINGLDPTLEETIATPLSATTVETP